MVDSATLIRYPQSTERPGADAVSLCIDQSYCPYFRIENEICENNGLENCADVDDQNGCDDDCCSQSDKSFKYKFFSNLQESTVNSECSFNSLQTDAFGVSQSVADCNSANFAPVFLPFRNIDADRSNPYLLFTFSTLAELEESAMGLWEKGGGSIWVAKQPSYGFVPVQRVLFTQRSESGVNDQTNN